MPVLEIETDFGRNCIQVAITVNKCGRVLRLYEAFPIKYICSSRLIDKVFIRDNKMAGNEIEVCKFLFSSIGNINLEHIGPLCQIGAPLPKTQGSCPVQTLDELMKISTEDSRKKADIYLNGVGVSIKQIGGSNLFNRLQRAKIIDVFASLQFSNPQKK